MPEPVSKEAREAAWKLAERLGVPDITGPRNQEETAVQFALFEQAIRRDEAEKCARQLEPIYHVLHCIYDECEDEGDRIYLGSTNDHHTLKRQLRRIEKLLLLGPAALRARHDGGGE